MTAQKGDVFKYKEKEYSIVAITNPLNFNPKDYGITPAPLHTGCWNGFWCVYNINDKGIFLEDLYINSKDGLYPSINNVEAVPNNYNLELEEYIGHHLYKNLNIKMLFSGKILVGDEFLREYYIHMGFQRGWAYKVLIELVFEQGQLIEINDQSEIASELRKNIKPKNKVYRKTVNDIYKFIDDSFNLDYRVKAWWLK
ncbi:MAG: hypothetical protein ACOX1L_06660 [Erysipelotrichaceae bacterium]|jgi:hypothetical protein